MESRRVESELQLLERRLARVESEPLVQPQELDWPPRARAWPRLACWATLPLPLARPWVVVVFDGLFSRVQSQPHSGQVG